MKKLKAVPFIVVGTLIHLGLGFAVFLRRASCNFQADCLATSTKICENLLALPLNFLVDFFHLGGSKASGFVFVYPVINSFLAVTIIWLLFIRPFVGRKGQGMRG